MLTRPSTTSETPGSRVMATDDSTSLVTAAGTAHTKSPTSKTRTLSTATLGISIKETKIPKGVPWGNSVGRGHGGVESWP